MALVSHEELSNSISDIIKNLLNSGYRIKPTRDNSDGNFYVELENTKDNNSKIKYSISVDDDFNKFSISTKIICNDILVREQAKLYWRVKDNLYTSDKDLLTDYDEEDIIDNLLKNLCRSKSARHANDKQCRKDSLDDYISTNNRKHKYSSLDKVVNAADYMMKEVNNTIENQNKSDDLIHEAINSNKNNKQIRDVELNLSDLENMLLNILHSRLI